MKQLILVLLLLNLFTSNAQPYTGQRWYSHGSPGPQLSSGSYVSSYPGFIMAGFLPTIASGSNFVIDKVDIDGRFNGSSGEFSQQYTITTGGNNCSVSLNTVVNCYGVSVIETFQGADHYAMTVAFDEGCIIAFLNSAGVVTTSTFYPFPSGSTFPSKPLITESLLNPGNYFIVGSYQKNSRTNIYAIKTNINFSSGWSNLYDCGNGTIFLPFGIVESSFNVGTGELIVAGEYITSGGFPDGFVMAIDDASNGSTINFSNSYHSSLASSTDRFSSIQLAYDNSGYILGGFSNATTNAYRAWMTRLSATGGYSWSKLVEFTNDGSAGDVVGVQERYNTSNSYEYYGLSKSSGGTSGMLVCKLDNSGAAFGGADEFYYSDGSIGESVAISHNNTPSDPNEGLHIFGNRTTSPEEFYLVQACFNGPSGNVSNSYQDVTTLTSISGGPNQQTSLSVNINSGLTPCSYYGIASASISVSINQPTGYLAGTAWPTTGGGAPVNGNNNRSFLQLNSDATEKDFKAKLAFFPNPVTNVLSIRFNQKPVSNFSLEIISPLGQCLYNKKYTLDESILVEVDIKSLCLKAGLYFVKITSDSKTYEGRLFVSEN